jgi:hypothetical protein
MNKHDRFLFRNFTASFGWAFMLFWLGMLIAFTQLYHSKGMPGANPLIATGVLGLFWIIGLPAALLVFRMPCIRAEVRNGALFVSEWTLFRLFTPRVHRFDLFEPPPEIVFTEGEDTEGCAYFRTEIVHPGGRLTIAEGHARGDVEEKFRKLAGLWTLGA